jgi:hypothetical protein
MENARKNVDKPKNEYPSMSSAKKAVPGGK